MTLHLLCLPQSAGRYAGGIACQFLAKVPAFWTHYLDVLWLVEKAARSELAGDGIAPRVMKSITLTGVALRSSRGNEGQQPQNRRSRPIRPKWLTAPAFCANGGRTAF